MAPAVSSAEAISHQRKRIDGSGRLAAREGSMESYAQTDVGLKRNSNQDFVYASDHRIGALEGLLIVADGMGGQAAGDLASRLCVEAMVDTIEGCAGPGTVKILSKAIRAANRAVVQRAGSDPQLEGMGTTLVAAAPDHGRSRLRTIILSWKRWSGPESSGRIRRGIIRRKTSSPGRSVRLVIFRLTFSMWP